MNPTDFTQDAPGRLVATPENACAFVPAPLPPVLPATWDLYSALSAADRGLSELSGVAGHLPNPHLLITPFMHREAVLSSRIEGTQSSYEDLVAYEAGEDGGRAVSADLQEVVNYVRALQYGLKRLSELPLCLRLIKEVHSELMRGVRGENKAPGEFRRGQVWLGGADAGSARFVPPPVPEMTEALDALETYLHARGGLPPLVALAIIHYQFETIHPFLDGNGRVGRLLVTLSLCTDGLLPLPLLYLSAFFEREKTTYNDLLLRVSQKGAWYDWIIFFLRGVAEQSHDGVARSKQLLELRERYRQQLQADRASGNTLRLLDELLKSPSTTIGSAAKRLGVTPQGAQFVVDRLVDAGILVPIPDTRPKRYVAKSIMSIFA